MPSHSRSTSGFSLYSQTLYARAATGCSSASAVGICIHPLVRGISFFCTLTITVLLSCAATAATYAVRDLGTAAGGITRISGINRSGVIVGNTALSGFTWSASSGYTYLSPLPEDTQSYAYGINDASQVVGASYSYSAGSRACLWQWGQPAEDLATLAGNATTESAAYGINSGGQIVGSMRSENGRLHAFHYDQATGMQDISGVASTQDSLATGINDSGMVVGESGQHAFSWTASGGLSFLSFSPMDIPNIHADDVNNVGLILCNTVSFAFAGPASIWQNGQVLVQAIGFPTGAGTTAGCTAYDINNLGQVVGDGDQHRPFVWDSTSGIQALPTLSGFGYHYARAVNDSGVIAGYGRDSAGVNHLLLWTPTPVPEPSSLLALLAGMGGLGALFRRRRR